MMEWQYSCSEHFWVSRNDKPYPQFKYPLEVLTVSWNKQPNVQQGCGLLPRAVWGIHRGDAFSFPRQSARRAQLPPREPEWLQSWPSFTGSPKKILLSIRFPPKRHSFPSSPVPSASLLGQLKTPLPTTDVCRWLFYRQPLLRGLTCADFCFAAKGHHS